MRKILEIQKICRRCLNILSLWTKLFNFWAEMQQTVVDWTICAQQQSNLDPQVPKLRNLSLSKNFELCRLYKSYPRIKFSALGKINQQNIIVSVSELENHLFWHMSRERKCPTPAHAIDLIPQLYKTGVVDPRSWKKRMESSRCAKVSKMRIGIIRT